MTTKKCKVAVYDCRTGKMRIEEREMPVYEPTPPQPSPIETVLYHVCKWIENEASAPVIKLTHKPIYEFITYYENTYGGNNDEQNKGTTK